MLIKLNVVVRVDHIRRRHAQGLGGVDDSFISVDVSGQRVNNDVKGLSRLCVDVQVEVIEVRCFVLLQLTNAAVGMQIFRKATG